MSQLRRSYSEGRIGSCQGDDLVEGAEELEVSAAIFTSLVGWITAFKYLN